MPQEYISVEIPFSGPLSPKVPWELPCIVEDVPFGEYLNIDAASSHALWDLLKKSPLHVKEGPKKKSDSMNLGTVFHTLLLEPDKAEQVAIKPADAGKGSNNSKRQLLDWLTKTTGQESSAGSDLAEGKMLSARINELEIVLDEMINEESIIVCSNDQWETANRMRDSALKRTIGQAVFDSGIAETTLLAFDPNTNVFCKGRIDWVPSGHEVLIDVKTATSASFDDFAKDCGRYGYHNQAAFYQWLYFLVTGKSNLPFLHFVIENQPPYDCAYYELDKPALQAGSNHFSRALKIWKSCEQMNYWPGTGYSFSQEEYVIQSLSLPKWAI